MCDDAYHGAILAEALAREHANILLVAKELERQHKESKTVTALRQCLPTRNSRKNHHPDRQHRRRRPRRRCRRLSLRSTPPSG